MAMARDAAVKPPEETTVCVYGATGYIGKNVVKECVRQGYKTVAFIRPSSAPREDFFEGATVLRGDVTSPESIAEALATLPAPPDVAISCLASRSGTPGDSELIDYAATRNTVDALAAAGGSHFILLSAFCVRKPELAFQRAKLRLEAELREAPVRHSIVRPTAFFKSVSGQLELLQQGWPYVMFGDGAICRCNAISESELAQYMVDCIADNSRWDFTVDLGGPDEGLTPRQQGEMLFDVLGKEPKFWSVPIGVFDAIIGALDTLKGFFPKQFEDPAELARIGRYYAVEDMLTTKPEEKFGKMTLRDHFERIAVEGQEYDAFTSPLAGKKQ